MKEKNIPQLQILNKLAYPRLSEKKLVNFIELNKSLKKDIRERINTIKEFSIKLEDNRIIKAGHIIFRPLANNTEISDYGFNHYAIVLGTTHSGERLIVDINEKRNVAIDSFENFKLKFPLSSVLVEENDKDLKTILDRAIEMQFSLYFADEFNCRHFVTYCIYGKKKSEAVKYLTEQISPFLKASGDYLDLRMKRSKNEKDIKVISSVKVFIEKVESIIKEINQ